MKNNNQTTFNPGMALATELVALIKGLAHAFVIPAIFIALGAESGMDSMQSITLGLIYLIFATFMYEYFAETEGQWLKSQKYYYGLLFLIGFALTILSTIEGCSNVL